MFFRLINISASFEGYIKKILVKKFDILMIVYLNDIRGFFKNFNQLHVDTGS